MLCHEACEKDSNATLIWHSVNQATLLVFFYCVPVEKPNAFKCFYDVPFLMNEQIKVLKDVEGIILTMVIQPIALGAVKASDAKGGNPMDLVAQNHQCKLSPPTSLPLELPNTLQGSSSWPTGRTPRTGPLLRPQDPRHGRVGVEEE